MAELKNMIIGVIALLFVASSVVTLYSYALTNNIDSGGTGEGVPFPLMNQTEAYTVEMNTYSQQLSNATINAADQPAASNAFTGIGALSQAGTAAISLSFSSVGMLVTMIGSAFVSLGPLGVPGVIQAFGILFITITIAFAILAAVFKWWI